MGTDTTYNGWSNYATWVVKLWIDNDQGSQERWQERARECLQDAIDSDESEPKAAAASTLARELESDHDESAPEVSGVFSDLLTHALGLVDWHEIAQNMLSDVDVFSAGWNMPGCMPDNAPALFLDADDARLHISDAMDRAAEQEDESEDPGTERAALETASLECLKGSGEYGATVAGFHYFVTKV